MDLQSVILKIKADFEKDIEELNTYKIKRTFTDEHIWTLKDETSIGSNIKQLISEADSSILFLAWNEKMEHYRTLLEQKEQQGLHVEVLSVGGLETSLTNKYALIPMLDKLEPLQLLIVDHAYLLFAGIENDSWKAIKTTSKPIVKAMTDYFIMILPSLKSPKIWRSTAAGRRNIQAAGPVDLLESYSFME